MERFVSGFVRASLIWLGVGVLLGLAMAVAPSHALVYRPAHLHANLLGFVSMMIFGVAYHVIPRFSGNPLRRPALAQAHLWLANVGLFAMVAAWMVRATAPAVSGWLLPAGALLSATGTALFIWNLWHSLGPVARPVSGPVLPVLQTPAGAARRS